VGETFKYLRISADVGRDNKENLTDFVSTWKVEIITFNKRQADGNAYLMISTGMGRDNKENLMEPLNQWRTLRVARGDKSM
jgi:hypothetical protein